MISKVSLILTVIVAITGAPSAYGAGNQQYYPRPIPLGVIGGNGVVGFDQTNRACQVQGGTLGGLVTDGTSQYIISAAHVLALGLSGYLASGSSEPVIQPILSLASTAPNPYHPPSCPPVGTDVTQFQVAALSTVIPINFSNGATNSYDAALAKILPGQVSSSIQGFRAFSGTPIESLKKRTKVQKVGAATGLTLGKYLKILKTVHYKICSHMYTQSKRVGNGFNIVPASCGPVEVHFGPHIAITPAIDQEGDSGALVFTEGNCPQPIGVDVGGNSYATYVAPLGPMSSLPGVLKALQTAAGSSASFSLVPGGGGCTATGQIDVELADGSTASVDGTVPDPDVLTALDARNDFMSTGWVPVLMDDGVVDGVAIDLSTNPASLDVTANDSTYDGVDDKTMAKSLLPTSYEGVAVEFTVTDVIDLTNSGSAYGG